ncbi:putative S-layer protein [Xenococcus sp. PCC 7305]|uniref:iron uptake porin n=1 Tax=Xenococcus sp. PCC 7305 TaxID=102125 RepID=UPI0002AC9618|nr:iron uptake porin [Xenococcus sp. PCC 7305]ELS02607.1 putative S-layer protein [Xenococcus sp. PCC 7305]
MSRLFWRALKAAPVVVAGSLLVSNATMAQTVASNESPVDGTLEQIDGYSGYEETAEDAMSQVTNVNQLRDVSPADWAYEALRSLVDRYGCIVGYPDQTYRGNQALSRYEFAAGLNACLNQIERLIASSEALLREDIETINKLLQEFEAELATLNGRVDSLEGRVAFLEDHQFSTTTKLKGEVIFTLGNTFGDDIDSQFTFSDRVRLNFNTSFTGKDILRTRLQAGNTQGFKAGITGTDSTRLGFDQGGNSNDIRIDDLYYRFPVGDKVRVWLAGNSIGTHNILNVGNPYLKSTGAGALSRFHIRNPLIFRPVQGTGLGTNVKLSDLFTFNASYLSTSNDGADPSLGEGIFNGSFSAGAQLVASPTDNFEINFAYIRTFETGDDVNISGSTVSGNAKRPFGRVDTSTNRFGLGANYQFGDRVAIAATGAYADASERGGDGSADIWTWSANIAFLDLMKEGSVLAVAGGLPPKLTDGDGVTEDEDSSYIIELFYKYPVNKNIIVTPGVYVVTNPDHDDSNDAAYVGVIRTTFKF